MQISHMCMNEFVTDIIQNIQIAMNEITWAKIQIGTYVFIEEGRDTQIRLYELESRLESKYVTIHIYEYVHTIQHTHRRVPMGDHNSRPNDWLNQQNWS